MSRQEAASSLVGPTSRKTHRERERIKQEIEKNMREREEPPGAGSMFLLRVTQGEAAQNAGDDWRPAAYASLLVHLSGMVVMLSLDLPSLLDDCGTA